MADSGFSSSASTTSTFGGGTVGMTIDQMHGLLKEFRAVYESRLRLIDEAEPCEDTQKVVVVPSCVYPFDDFPCWFVLCLIRLNASYIYDCMSYTKTETEKCQFLLARFM